MSGLGRYLLAASIAAVVAHFAAIHFAPRLTMQAAMARLSEAAGGANAWRLAPPTTAESRTVVRPSPDFAYSACVYDLSQGPLRIAIGPFDGYWSLSLYAANSDNYFVLDDREADDGAELVLVRRGRAPPDEGERAVESPSKRGVALIRRLAPRGADYARAREAARGDVCAPL